MKRLVRILLCLSLIVFVNSPAISRAAPPKSSAAASAKKTTGKKATAAQLVAAAKKANAAMIKNARADKGLDPKVPKNKPFYTAAKKVTTQLDRADKGLAAKNNDFFDAVSGARSAQEQLKVAWNLTDSKNKKVAADAVALGNALDLLRRDFSKEAARKKKGGELTAKEKAEFAKIKAHQKELLAKINKLQAKSTKDKALQRGLAKMEKESRRIANAKMNLADYLAALYLLDDLEGQLYGYDYYIDPAWRSDWIVVDKYVDYYTPIYANVWTDYAYDWDYVTTPVDIYVDDNVYVDDSLSPTEVDAQEDFVDNGDFDMSPAEAAEVAADDADDAQADADDAADDAQADADDGANDASMDDADGDSSGDMNEGDADDDGGNMDDGAADNDGGDMDDG
ncbi:MAG: hypothetical protein H0U23_03305, partial [Blastocatellia bacterium]|nr:hypothetical protein [Blastocatellia bacterium]